MSFSEVRSRNETRKRTSAEYFKFTQDYRSVGRILDPKARTIWKHWISVANGGKGMGAVCLNTEPRMDACPIERKYADLPKDNPERKANNARPKFVVNILDRTPYTTCKACNTQTPGKVNQANGQKQCFSCGASLKDHDFKPLNRVKILEGGPRLFNDNLNPIAEMQKADLGKDITEYDITFSTTGEGRDRKVNALPQPPSELEEDALIDPDTGEEQKLFDLELLAEPPSSEEIELMLEGATIDQLNALRGIE